MQQVYRRECCEGQEKQGLVTVVASVERDLARIAKRDPDLAESSLAAAALVLAERMDDQISSPTAVSNCARALTEILDRIRALVPPQAERDGVDEIADARAKRRAG